MSREPSPLGPVARALLLALAFAPALATALLVHRFAVNVPVWDDWERAKLLERHEEGTLDLAYLYSPHIDHRIVIPRLVALANAKLSGSNLVVEQWLCWVILLAGALAAHALLRRSLGAGIGGLYGLTFLINLALFSPLQWENLLWAAQPFFLFPFAALAGALLALGASWSLAARFAVCLLLAVAATHTFSHGLTLWPAVLAAALLSRRGASRRGRAAFAAAWLVAAALVLLPYFSVDGMRNTSESDHSFDLPTGERAPGLAWTQALGSPFRPVRFFLAVLGSGFARTTAVPPRALAVAAGALVAAALAAALLAWLARARDRDLFERGLPWAILGGTSAGLCALAALGRTAVMKWAYALLPHYFSISVWALVATGVLGVLLARDARARLGAARPALAAFCARAPAFAAGFLAVALGLGWLVGMDGMRDWHAARLQARTSLLFLRHFEPRYVRRLTASVPTARRLATALDRYGYLDPPLLPDTSLDHFALAPRPLDVASARIQEVRVHDQRVSLSGFAWLAHAGRPADGVLLAVRDAQGVAHAVALAEIRGLPRLDVPRHDHIFNDVAMPDPERAGAWSGQLEASRLPGTEELAVELFAVESDRMRVHRLGEWLHVRRGPDGLVVEIRDGAPA